MPETGFLSHYRDNDEVEVEVEVEVDFVLKSALREIAGKQFMTGIVIYDGKDALYFGDVLWAVPLSGP